MKILILVNDLTLGVHGYGTYARHIIDQANQAGDEVVALVNKKVETGDLICRQIGGLSDPLRLLWHPLRNYQQARTIKQTIKLEKPDVIHIITESYVMPWIFLKKKTPLVLTVHGTFAYLPDTAPEGMRRFISKILFYSSLKKVDQVLVVSETVKRQISVHKGLYKNLSVLKNVITLPKDLSAKDDSLKDKYRAITIGQVKRRKGIADSIPILSNWAKSRNRKIEYQVVGDFDEGSAYIKQVRELIKEFSHDLFSVNLLGRVSEQQKSDFLCQSDLYIHLERIISENSDREGFGIGIIEAAAYGVPALVANGSATTEAVLDGESGYHIDLGENKVIFSRLDAILLERRITRTKLTAWAMQHSPLRFYQQLRNIYKNLT